MSLVAKLRHLARVPLERVYEERLARRVRSLPKPRHVGVILDGNRRWAAGQGGPASRGHRVGASRIAEFLNWCSDDDIEVVTLWLLSTDNLHRSDSELIPLLTIIEQTATDLARIGKWRLHHVGSIEALPARTQNALRQAEHDTRDVSGPLVNMAVGYGGRDEVVDAVRSYLQQAAASGKQLQDCADSFNINDIAGHLYTKGQPDPDLVIRTSGEQRLSGFLLWQSAHSEYWFCEAYWPDFRRIDFLRALRDFGTRKRRFGG